MSKLKMPKYVTRYGIVCTKHGIYTPFVDHTCKNHKQVQKWIDKNGFRLMQSMVRKKIEDRR